MTHFNDIDILWIVFCSFLIFMMQFGFALVETGTVRSKNTINVAMKNLIDTIFGIIFFWAIGFGLMFGRDVYSLVGWSAFFILGDDLYQNAFFIFQAMFAATSVTIVSGAVAERMKFNAYIITSIVVTALIYPIFGHWAWADGGWLKELGFHDFAGSSVVHSIGGWIGLSGALILGPRLGRFRRKKVNYFVPSNHNLIVFGAFILVFAWFGFNAGSLLYFDVKIASILLNTLLSAVFGGLGGWMISLFFTKKVGVEIFSFGIIAGLVGVTAGCDQYNTLQSAFIGFSSAFIMHITDQLLLNKFKVDDPLSVVAIHGFTGAWGTLCVGIFAPLPPEMLRYEFILIQVAGILAAFIFATLCGIALFLLLYKMDMLRVSKKNEVIGLNVTEHGAKLPWVDTVESIIKIMKTGDLRTKIHEEKDTEVGIVVHFFNYLLSILNNKQIELDEINKDLKIISQLDPLTKIMNRRSLLEKIKGRNPFSNTMACAIIDIDFFKKINDTYGHNVGDSVLQELTRLICLHIRNNDLFARWGGEEFLLILHTNNPNFAQSAAEKLRHIIEKHSFLHVGKITVSIGVSLPKDSSISFDELFEKADKALYEAKNLGRNRVCLW
jgi:Amt family ammonium transporter